MCSNDNEKYVNDADDHHNNDDAEKVALTAEQTPTFNT